MGALLQKLTWVRHLVPVILLLAGLVAILNISTILSWLLAYPPTVWLSYIAPFARDLLTLTLSIIIGALPFVVLGVSIAITLRFFLPTGRLLEKLPKNLILRRLLISCFGFAMPACECGNVPVARGLLARGMPVHESVLFLLAAPIVNPITLITTLEAFNFDKSIAVWRIGAALVIANIICIVISLIPRPQRLLTKSFRKSCEIEAHEHRSGVAVTNAFSTEMWTILRTLVIGALIAAATQVFIPREVITAIGTDPLLSVLAMLILAFVISICSSVDAFFALAYARVFSSGSIVSFLVAGPMVDIKMLAIMKTTFRWPLLLLITGLVLGLSFILGIGVNYVAK